MTRRTEQRLSEHFQRHEFACHCGCGADTVDAALVSLLEEVRTRFGHPLAVVSGMRCAAHNRAVGGAPSSMHLEGKAADVKIRAVHPDDVADFLESLCPDGCGIGRYDDFTHIDVRPGPARWDRRT